MPRPNCNVGHEGTFLKFIFVHNGQTSVLRTIVGDAIVVMRFRVPKTGYVSTIVLVDAMSGIISQVAFLTVAAFPRTFSLFITFHISVVTIMFTTWLTFIPLLILSIITCI